jgi:S-adenosylmethionine:tRNA ribosyltransferase-isomerase
MRLSDFDYQLPQELIAQTPLTERSASRMLLVDPLHKAFSDRQFVEIVDCIEAGDLLVFNDTMVIPARLFGRKQSGGQIEVMVERVLDETTLLAQIRASKAPRPGTELLLEGAISCVMQAREGDLFRLQQQQRPWLELLEQYGHVPLPVAAPTAGLHFDDAILERLRQKGVEFAHVTLHVGAGTFQPVRGDDIESHVMHAELVDVPQPVCDAIAATRERGNKVIAVGTTVVRSLETAAANGKLQPLLGESNLFIKPGYEFRIVDALLTNFHLPRSTLLILVSAFAGTGLMRLAYEHAVEQRYRFFSYGDAMFIENRAPRDR